MSEKQDKLTPEQVLLNTLADCGRIERIVIIADTKDGYELWSNGLDLADRAGLLHVALKRTDRSITRMEELDIED